MSQQPAYAGVVEEIARRIETKALTIGDRLDGERALADEYRVSRTSVREAIRVLATLGIVESAAGSGPSAGSRIISRPETALAAALRLHLAVDSFDVDDVLESRVMLETWAYRSVGTPAPEAVEEIRGIVSRMQAVEDRTAYLALDAELHVRMVELAGNPLLTAFMSALRSSVSAYTSRTAETIADWADVSRTLDREHAAILDALAEGDGARGAALAEQHIHDYARLGGPGRRRP